MKRNLLLIVLFGTMMLGGVSCTEQTRVRQFGGDMTVDLPSGEKLVMATWKEDNLFYLTEPMDPDYQPKTKIFRESSSWGVLESQITFVEHR